MFNTLKYAHKMAEVGFSRLQAETSINILVDIMNDNLASKQDITDLKNELGNLRHELKAEQVNLKQEFKFELSHLESRMTIKLGTMMIALVAVVAGIQKFFMH